MYLYMPSKFPLNISCTCICPTSSLWTSDVPLYAQQVPFEHQMYLYMPSKFPLNYGAAVWPVPRTYNLLYLHNQTGKNTRQLVSKLFNDICGFKIPFVYAKRVGQITDGDTVNQRKILIKLVSYSQKLFLLRDYSHILVIMRIKRKRDGKFHQNFCSKNDVNAELGRCPIMHKAWDLAVKYWLQLDNGTETRFSMKHSSKQKLSITTGFKGCNICYVQMFFAIYGSILWILTNKPPIKCLFNDLIIIAKNSLGS